MDRQILNYLGVYGLRVNDAMEVGIFLPGGWGGLCRWICGWVWPLVWTWECEEAER